MIAAVSSERLCGTHMRHLRPSASLVVCRMHSSTSASQWAAKAAKNGCAELMPADRAVQPVKVNRVLSLCDINIMHTYTLIFIYI